MIRLEKNFEKLSDRMTDLETRSMNHNVVFFGIVQKAGENTEVVIRSFIRDELALAENLDIDNCHRFGDPTSNKKPIVVAFVRRSQMERVLKSGFRLKGKPFHMSEQVSMEVRTTQKLLLEERKSIKQNDQNARVAVRGERLIQNGAVVKDMKKMRNNACKDMNMDIVKAALALDSAKAIKRTEVFDVKGSKFLGHYIKLTDPAESRAAIAAVCRDPKVALATHNMWALRMGNVEELCDDGEWEGSYHILRAMRAQGVSDGMVVVTRWYSGAHIGKDRFTAIERAAKLAMTL